MNAGSTQLEKLNNMYQKTVDYETGKDSVSSFFSARDKTGKSQNWRQAWVRGALQIVALSMAIASFQPHRTPFADALLPHCVHTFASLNTTSDKSVASDAATPI